MLHRSLCMPGPIATHYEPSASGFGDSCDVLPVFQSSSRPNFINPPGTPPTPPRRYLRPRVNARTHKGPTYDLLAHVGQYHPAALSDDASEDCT